MRAPRLLQKQTGRFCERQRPFWSQLAPTTLTLPQDPAMVKPDFPFASNKWRVFVSYFG